MVLISCEVVSSSSCQEKLLADGDATGDGGVHRAQRVLAARWLGLYVRPRRRRGRTPPPVGHSLIVQLSR